MIEAIDSLDARYERGRIEVGLFDADGICLGIVSHCKVDAVNLRDSLVAALNELDANYDPTPWCSGCGAMAPSGCHCGPLADND